MKKFILITMLIMVSACGMNRPFPPTLTSISGSSAVLPYGTQNSSYLSVWDLADAHLDWDVSNVPGADGVKIVASREYTCATEIASNYYNIINSRQRTAVTGGMINPQENLKVVFQGALSQFAMGRYFICVKATKMGQEGPPSTPVSVELLQNEPSYLQAAGATNGEIKEEKLTQENDPYFSGRPENL